MGAAGKCGLSTPRKPGKSFLVDTKNDIQHVIVLKVYNCFEKKNYSARPGGLKVGNSFEKQFLEKNYFEGFSENLIIERILFPNTLYKITGGCRGVQPPTTATRGVEGVEGAFTGCCTGGCTGG